MFTHGNEEAFETSRADPENNWGLSGKPMFDRHQINSIIPPHEDDVNIKGNVKYNRVALSVADQKYEDYVNASLDSGALLAGTSDA